MIIYAYDTPIDFTTDIKLNDFHFSFYNLREICQGGPCVGKLFINGEKISEYEFGGPFLFEDKFIYIPLYTKFSFVLVEINLLDQYSIRRIGSYENLIFLKQKECNKIYYYNTINKSVVKNITI